MAQFQSGATRNVSEGKPDYEGFLSPLVIERYGEYMNTHRKTADGGFRESDNWQLGIPQKAYMKSLWRHFLSVWTRFRGYEVTPKDPRDPQDMEEDLCAVIFNASGMLHEIVKERKRNPPVPVTVPKPLPFRCDSFLSPQHRCPQPATKVHRMAGITYVYHYCDLHACESCKPIEEATKNVG